jgi:hypothetical protein
MDGRPSLIPPLGDKLLVTREIAAAYANAQKPSHALLLGIEDG